MFYSLYMTQQKRKIKLCYDLVKLIYPDIPSVSSFERRVRRIPRYAILYYREGPKVYNDARSNKVISFIVRDASPNATVERFFGTSIDRYVIGGDKTHIPGSGRFVENCRHPRTPLIQEASLGRYGFPPFTQEASSFPFPYS